MKKLEMIPTAMTKTLKNRFLSVDLGGTHLRVALLDPTGKILEIQTISSTEVQAPEALVQRLAGVFQILMEQCQQRGERVLGAALGVPGLVQHPEGIIRQSPHFPQWKDFALKGQLKKRTTLPLSVENDANQAALGEATFGAGRGLEHFVMVTLGTGVGGGIILNGKIFHGAQGFAGEVGHITIDRDNLAGAIGIQGTFETFNSLSGMRMHLKEQWQKDASVKKDKELTALDLASPELPQHLARLAKAGNSLAQGVWQEFGRNLACGLSSVALTLGIFDFIIGGGLSGAADLFLPACQQEIPKRMYQTTAELMRIRVAELGNEAGLKGAVPLLVPYSST